LDEVEAQYAPQDHPVFQLVPSAFHDRADHLYSTIGRPEIKIDNFWDIYLDLLKRLRDGSDEALTRVLSDHQESSGQQDEGMPLLPNMQPFRLGHPLDVGNNVNYIGGIDVSALPSSVPVPCPEFAYLTSDEESDGSSDELDVSDGDD
jgi:hypothetical protein